MSIWLGVALYVVIGLFIGAIAAAKFILKDKSVDEWVNRPQLVQRIDIFESPEPWFFGIGVGFLWPLALLTYPTTRLTKWLVRRKANTASALATLNNPRENIREPQKPSVTTTSATANIPPNINWKSNWIQTPTYTKTSTDGS